MSSTSETAPLHRDEERKSQGYFLANITLIARIFGLITLIVMWVCAILLVQDHRNSFAGYYLIAASIVVSFFEFTWILDKCACCVREGCCCRFWAVILWVDNWKKFILYLGLSVPLFVEGMRYTLGIITGFLMVLMSILYLVKTFRRYVSIKYEKSEKRVTLDRQVIRHETSTQTDVNDQQVLSTNTTTTSSTSQSAAP